MKRELRNVTTDSQGILPEPNDPLTGGLAKTQIYIDDCAQTGRNKSAGVFANQLMNSIYLFVKVRNRLKLCLSDKGKIVCNCLKTAKRMQRELLRLHGIKYDIVIQTRDLGVSYTAGACKPNLLTNQRFSDKKGRMHKIGKIAGTSRLARKLFSGSGFAASTWGHQASGLSSTDLLLLERFGAKSTGITPAGRCRFSANCVAFGQYGHPKARIIRETFQAYFHLTFELLKNKNESGLRVSWFSALAEIKDKGAKAIRGPMGNTIHLLLEYGWKPISYHTWQTHDPEFSFVINDLSASPKAVINCFLDRVNQVDAARAETHYCGEGLSGGADWNNTTVWHRSKNISYAQKCALETIFCAAFWPNCRVHSIKPDISPICTRCNTGALDTPLHCFWSCPANATFTDEAVTSTQEHIALAEAFFQESACFWCRGIIPLSEIRENMAQYDPSENLEIITSPFSVLGDRVVEGTIYGDASGGKFNIYPDLRRVGVGLARIDSNGDLIWAISFNLPGKIQTVPRGELYAIVRAAQEAHEGATIDFVTDNMGNYDKFNSGRDAAILTNNGDLFKILFDEIRIKDLNFTVRWMPSHLDIEDLNWLPSDISALDLKGNEFADKQADKAAENHLVDLNASSHYLWYINLAQQIQRRLVVIMCSLTSRTGPNRPSPPPTTSARPPF